MIGYFDDPETGAVTASCFVRNTGKLIEKLQAIEYFLIAFGRKILWLGVSEGNERMQGLNSAVNKALHLEPESFIPHLTLARNKNASNAEFGKALSVLKKLEISESFLVEGFELMESMLSEKGALHSKIASFRLSKS